MNFVGISAESPNGQSEVEISEDGRTRLWIDGELVADKELSLQGHHLSIYLMDESERMLIVDPYVGWQLYDKNLTLIKAMDGDEMLAMAHESRFGQWACHTEGSWLEEFQVVKGEVAQFSVGSGTVVDINLYDTTATVEKRAASTIISWQIIVAGLVPFAVIWWILKSRRTIVRG